MWANRIINILVSLLALLVIPVQLVTTLVLGVLVSISCGLLLIPFSLIWAVLFMGPLFGLSWLWDKVPLLRIPVGCCGIVIAVVGDVYCALLPTMGELGSRFVKMALCETFPYTLDCWAFMNGRGAFSIEDHEAFEKVLRELSHSNRRVYQYLMDPARR